MAGSEPFRKRLARRSGALGRTGDAAGPDRAVTGAHEAAGAHAERGPGASLAAADGRGEGPSPEAGPPQGRAGRWSRGARAGLTAVVDRIIATAPRVPVRDLATLRGQFPGLGPEEIADKLVSGAANGTSTVGAGIGAAAMLPVPPAMPAELAAEIVGVAAVEFKLIAELHEVYGLRAPGTLRQRTLAYLAAWADERGVDVTKPTSVNAALGGQLRRELRQRVLKRTFRNLPNLTPFMIGATVGAVMNRRDTRRLAEKVRADLRRRQVPWAALPSPEGPQGAL
ncbi:MULTISPECIES: EcsC family protein [Streptomyces]|uniref:EcsC family protein n=1 Tax=Streptomyces TaxID=1883 RepID=UPI001C8D788E|nr:MULTISPECIES: EcsC family protein [Streptomyces]UBI36369.1 EcsC family protein [Streptomyces mobaraensis]UKW28963.1 EcsC family protein [Streptomyces sp. TYQ1024]